MKVENENEEVQEFWQNLEEEIGEPITVYTLGEYRQGNLDLTPPKVGLFYLTETALFFQTFPKSNWFSAIIGGFGKKKKEEKGQTVKIPFDQIGKAYLQKPTFMEKIFSPKMPVVVVTFIDTDGTPGELAVATDEKGVEIVEKISSRKE